VMAIRTTDAAVKLLLGDNYDTDGAPSLAGLTSMASSVVDQVVACAAALTPAIVLTATVLERMEAALTAHYYGSSDQFYKSKKTEEAAAAFVVPRYDEMALALDSSGCLRGILDGGSTRVGGVWLGKRPSVQVDYVDRD